MVIKVITANAVEHSLCARHSSKLFLCTNLFNSHNDPRRWVLYYPPFIDKKGRLRKVK